MLPGAIDLILVVAASSPPLLFIADVFKNDIFILCFLAIPQ
jgi:hypothetical protein